MGKQGFRQNLLLCCETGMLNLWATKPACSTVPRSTQPYTEGQTNRSDSSCSSLPAAPFLLLQPHQGIHRSSQQTWNAHLPSTQNNWAPSTTPYRQSAILLLLRSAETTQRVLCMSCIQSQYAFKSGTPGSTGSTCTTARAPLHHTDSTSAL